MSPRSSPTPRTNCRSNLPCPTPTSTTGSSFPMTPSFLTEPSFQMVSSGKHQYKGKQSKDLLELSSLTHPSSLCSRDLPDCRQNLRAAPNVDLTFLAATDVAKTSVAAPSVSLTSAADCSVSLTSVADCRVSLTSVDGLCSCWRPEFSFCNQSSVKRVEFFKTEFSFSKQSSVL